MLCSAAEIGLGDEQSGIIMLDPSVAPGQNAARLLGIDDAILEIGVTPNRGDCLSVRGIAREIAAVCDLSLTAEFRRETSSPPGAGRVSIRIDADDACPLYTGIEVRDVRVGPSPPWLAARLRACGLRPINNVVDVTNYLLWECGQPLHAFDADLLAGPEISVARAGDERAIETLDGQSRRLEAHDLVIRDRKGAVALAGVMGGARTAVRGETRNLFLESAIFAPRSVRATSRRLGLISDSSYRFERGVDPAGVERTLVRAATLIAEIAGGRIEGGVCRAGAGVPARPAIRLRPCAHRGPARRERLARGSRPLARAARRRRLERGRRLACGDDADSPPRPRARDRPDRRGRAPSRLRQDRRRRSCHHSIGAGRACARRCGRARTERALCAGTERDRRALVLLDRRQSSLPRSARRCGGTGPRGESVAKRRRRASSQPASRSARRTRRATYELARSAATSSRLRGRSRQTRLLPRSTRSAA